MSALLLSCATLADGSRADVRLDRGRIARVAPAGELEARAGEDLVGLDGYLLLPAPAEPHAHLDKALSADRFDAVHGDLPSAVAAWFAHRAGLGVDDILERARTAALTALRCGATAIRSHVDVGPGIELRAAQALVAAREQLQCTVTLQVCAMAYPVTGAAGASNLALMREAIALGVDVVGGAPHLDPEPTRALELYLKLAAEHGLPVDLHMDEHTRDGLDLRELARLVAAGFPHQVTASHCVSLGMRPPEQQAVVAEAVAQAGIAVVTCPATNLYLQGRDRPAPMPRGLTGLAALAQAGVVVAGGGDNVQDPFNPLGRGDPLQTAQLLVLAGHLGVEQAYAAVSDRARAAIGVPAGRIRPDQPADLLAVAGGSLREALATAGEQRIVVRAGRIVARTSVRRDA